MHRQHSYLLLLNQIHIPLPAYPVPCLNVCAKVRRYPYPPTAEHLTLYICAETVISNSHCLHDLLFLRTIHSFHQCGPKKNTDSSDMSHSSENNNIQNKHPSETLPPVALHNTTSPHYSQRPYLSAWSPCSKYYESVGQWLS